MPRKGYDPEPVLIGEWGGGGEEEEVMEGGPGVELWRRRGGVEEWQLPQAFLLPEEDLHMLTSASCTPTLWQ